MFGKKLKQCLCGFSLYITITLLLLLPFEQVVTTKLLRTAIIMAVQNININQHQ